ncbi:hypothetical protein Dimus_030493 [Dionaea muscipula]
MHVAACKEFYADLTVSLSKRKEVATSMVRGVKIELDSMILASILEFLATLVLASISMKFRKSSKVNEEEEVHQEFNWKVVIDEVEIEREEVNQEAEIQGEHMEKEVEAEESGSGEKFFDAVDEERPDEVDIEAPDVPTPTPSSVQQKEKNAAEFDPSAPTGSVPNSTFQHLEAEFERARANKIQAELGKA